MTLIPYEKRRELADSIRHYMDEDRHDAIRFVYEPGDATHYEFMLARCDTTPLTGACADEWMPYLRPVDLRSGYWLLASVGLKSGGCAMAVDLSDCAWNDPAYISEKLRLAYGSAVVIAELLAMITDAPTVWLDRLRADNPHTFGKVSAGSE